MKNDYQEKYIELFESLYEDNIQAGMTLDMAQANAYTVVEHCKEIIEGVNFMMDEGYYVAEDGNVNEEGNGEWQEGEFYVNIRYSMMTKDIPGWMKLDDHSKELALFNLGFDINLPCRIRYGLHPQKEGAPIETTYVEGSERLDYGWAHSGRASLEAIMEFEKHTRGYDHYRDLQQMSRTS